MEFDHIRLSRAMSKHNNPEASTCSSQARTQRSIFFIADGLDQVKVHSKKILHVVPPQYDMHGLISVSDNLKVQSRVYLHQWFLTFF